MYYWGTVYRLLLLPFLKRFRFLLSSISAFGIMAYFQYTSRERTTPTSVLFAYLQLLISVFVGGRWGYLWVRIFYFFCSAVFVLHVFPDSIPLFSRAWSDGALKRTGTVGAATGGGGQRFHLLPSCGHHSLLTLFILICKRTFNLHLKQNLNSNPIRPQIPDFQIMDDYACTSAWAFL